MVIDEAAIRKILAGCKKGNQYSQQQLYETYYRSMLNVCVRYCNSIDEAKDMVHDGFLKIFKNVGKYKYRGSFDGWMRQVMVNNIIDSYRKNKYMIKNTSKEIDVEDINIQEDDDKYDKYENIKQDDVVKAIQGLPPAYRTIFNLYVVDGLTHDEISEKLGISTGTSKSNLFKARNNLKKKLMKKVSVQ